MSGNILLSENIAAADAARPHNAPQVNAWQYGQNGLMVNPQGWTSHTPFVRQNVIPVLYQPPLAFKYLKGNTALMIQALKALIETLPKTIDGLQQTITVESGIESMWGNSGEMFQMPSKVAIERTVPSIIYDEKHNRLIQNWWKNFIRLFVGDPLTGILGIINEAGYVEANKPQLLAEQLTFTVLFIEPDRTMTYPVRTYMVANMSPQTAGEDISKKEKQGSSELVELTIPFTGLTLPSLDSINELGYLYLESLNLKNVRTADLKPFTSEIDASVKAAQTGYLDNIAQAIANQPV